MGRSSSWTVRLMLAGVIGLVVLFGVGTLIVAFGVRRGVEFSPHLFRQRAYTFLELPLTHWQITPAASAPTTNQLMTHLTSNGFVQTVRKGARWDATQRREIGAFPRGDAAVLLAYLEANDSQGKSIWLQWTTDQPAYAKVLWPAVAQLARDGLYLPLPELFRMAWEAPEHGPPGTFQEELDAWMVEQYRWYARAERESGSPARADLYQRRARAVEAEASSGQAGGAEGDG